MYIAALIETRAASDLIDPARSPGNVSAVSRRWSRVFSWTVTSRFLGSPSGTAWLSLNGEGSEKSCRETARRPRRRRTTICCRSRAVRRLSRRKGPQNVRIRRWSSSRAFSARCPPPHPPHVRPLKSCESFSLSGELSQFKTSDIRFCISDLHKG